MKKNKIIFLAFVLTLVIGTIGCTTRPQRPMNQGTQNRIGLGPPSNNITRQRNTNMMGVDRRNMDNLSNMNPNFSNNMIRRNTGLGPNTTTDITQRNRTGTDNMSTRANAIAQKIANLNEVNNCSVLLSGNTAIVGVDMENNLQGKMTTDLKQKIEKTVKDADNSIKNVSVTADPNLYTRISNMAKDIRDGRPISGFANEFQEILRRITPVR